MHTAGLGGWGPGPSVVYKRQLGRHWKQEYNRRRIMATVTAPIRSTQEATRKSPAGNPQVQAQGRLAFLDVFRGLTMLLVISHGFGIHEALKDNAQLGWLRYQFDHTAWTGCTLWDLIQPAFTFI